MHGRPHRTVGLTLIETTLVVATIALMVGLALPAVRALVHSFQSEGGTKSIIQAALNSARTMAVTHQRYVGVRFQKACISEDPCDPLKRELNAPQYMIFIMQEAPDVLNLDNGFRALKGHEPIKLPDTIGVMQPEAPPARISLVSAKLPGMLNDMTTFSIIFSPSGRLVVHKVRVRNRDGVYLPANDPGSTKVSQDDIFNSAENICRYKEGMFIQDDYSTLKNPSARTTELGLGEEDSVTSFFTYETATLRTLYTKLNRPDPDVFTYLDALAKDKSVYVSPYTGNLVSSD